jgi:sugar/nucleoside kinase (ribokinase family)
MILVLGDLLLDLSLRIPSFPIIAEAMFPLEHLELGPGGASNVAITAARLGLEVGCMGEIGDDRFGHLLLEGLRRERVHTSTIQMTPGGATPVACCLVDQAAEPAYLGYPGRLTVEQLSSDWANAIASCEAVFADGWIDHSGGARLILQAFDLARQAGIPTFFDPGPGNPRHDQTWMPRVAGLSTVVLGTEDQITRVADQPEPVQASRVLLEQGATLVVIKRGARGCTLVRKEELVDSPAFPVEVVDKTGAGDSLDGAVLYGYLRGLALSTLGALGNAAGAAKVRKPGTGHSMPTAEEIREVLSAFGHPTTILPTP